MKERETKEDSCYSIFVIKDSFLPSKDIYILVINVSVEKEAYAQAEEKEEEDEGKIQID